MPKCVYCGKIYEFPRGLTLVGKDGTINYLCSGKCRKNRTMKRRKVRWVIKGKKIMAAADKVAAEKKKK